MTQNPIEKTPHINFTPELIMKLAALLLALGLLVGKLNGVDERLARIERFMDSHVAIEVK